MTLPSELRALIESGPLTHLSTISADGSPQVSVIWLGLDGEDLVTAHMRRNQLKLRNIDRDPRVVLSFLAPPEPGVFLAQHAVIKATGDDRGADRGRVGAAGPAAKLYVAPDTTFPAPRGAGWIVRYAVEKIGGVGPWVS